MGWVMSIERHTHGAFQSTRYYIVLANWSKNIRRSASDWQATTLNFNHALTWASIQIIGNTSCSTFISESPKAYISSSVERPYEDRIPERALQNSAETRRCETQNFPIVTAILSSWDRMTMKAIMFRNWAEQLQIASADLVVMGKPIRWFAKMIYYLGCIFVTNDKRQIVLIAWRTRSTRRCCWGESNLRIAEREFESSARVQWMRAKLPASAWGLKAQSVWAE